MPKIKYLTYSKSPLPYAPRFRRGVQANSKLIKCLQILLVTLFSYTATAATKDYQVELIIFKYNDTKDIHQEGWPLVELKNTKNAITLNDPKSHPSENNIIRSQEKFTDFDYELMDDYENNTNQANSSSRYYNLLSSNQIKHKAIANRIHGNSRYTVLSHIGWRQPQADLAKSKTIKFQTGKVYNLQSINTLSDTAPVEADNTLPPDLTAQLSGTIKLSLRKYVHADMNLLLNLPAKTVNNNQQPFELISQDLDSIDTSSNTYLHPFLISENRRLKDDQPNYFDHPVFGAILVVNELKS